MHRPHTVDQSTVPTPAAFPRASRCRATQAARIPPRREKPAPILPSRPMTSHPTPTPPRGDRRVSTNSRRPTGTQARTKAATGVEPLPRRHPPNSRPQREKMNGAEREGPAPRSAGHRPEHQLACPSRLPDGHRRRPVRTKRDSLSIPLSPTFAANIPRPQVHNVRHVSVRLLIYWVPTPLGILRRGGVREPVSRGAHRAHFQGVPPGVSERLTERLKTRPPPSTLTAHVIIRLVRTRGGHGHSCVRRRHTVLVRPRCMREHAPNSRRPPSTDPSIRPTTQHAHNHGPDLARQRRARAGVRAGVSATAAGRRPSHPLFAFVGHRRHDVCIIFIV